MPVHDWMRVSAGTFYDLHASWITHLKETLNAGLTPDRCYAQSEQDIGAMGPDVLTLQTNGNHHLENPASPSEDKGDQGGVLGAPPQVRFTLIIDLFPPAHAIRKGFTVLSGEIDTQPCTQPPDKPLTLVAYQCAERCTAYIEPIAVGDALIDMPLFLDPDSYVNVPLERTDQQAYQGAPRRWRQVLEAS